METYKPIPVGEQAVTVKNFLNGSAEIIDQEGETIIRLTPSYPEPTEEQAQAVADKMQEAITAQIDREILNAITGATNAQFKPEHRQPAYKHPTKRPAAETKRRRKIAKASRKINRRK
jgi:phospholipase/lecithinase/hemolysin